MAAKRRMRGLAEGGRNAKPALSIVCEGDTEYNYFKDLKGRFRASWMIPLKSDRPDPKGVMGCAEHEVKRYREKGLDVQAWILIDAESEAGERALLPRCAAEGRLKGCWRGELRPVF